MQVQREIGQRLREARQAAGMTQERAAAESGIDYKRYQRLEQGAVNATLRTLVRVATALRTDFWSLVGAETDEAATRPFVAHGASAVHERGRQREEGRRRVSVSRLMPADVSRAVEALTKKRERARWLRDVDPALADAIAAGVTRVDAPEGDADGAQVSFTWDDTDVDLTITARPDGRAMIVVKNRGLASDAEVEERRAAWTRALEALRAHLSS